MEGEKTVYSETALDTANQVAVEVSSVHDNNILHLDLKPDNVVFTDKQQAMVIDFGLTQALQGPPSTVAGSPSFLAPERLDGGSADVRTDIYGIGGNVYFLLTEKAPVEAESKSQTLEELTSAPIDFDLLRKSNASQKPFNSVGVASPMSQINGSETPTN